MCTHALRKWLGHVFRALKDRDCTGNNLSHTECHNLQSTKHLFRMALANHTGAIGSTQYLLTIHTSRC